MSTSNANTILQTIRANRLMELPVSWSDELIFPHLNGYSIVNLAQSIMQVLGVTDANNPLDAIVWGDNPPENIERVVLFISDGLGYHYLNQMTNQDDIIRGYVDELSEGRGISPLTSILPSTTVAALPTLWTGVAPGVHGMVGTHMFLKEVSMLCNILRFTPSLGKHPNGLIEEWGVSGDTFVTIPSLAQRLHNADVTSYSVMERTLVGSGLSKILHRGVDHNYSHRSTADMWVRLREILAETRHTKSYICVYVDHIDRLSHEYGAHNAYTQAEVAHQFGQLSALLADPALSDGRTLYLIAADHGHYDTPNPISVDKHPELAVLRDAMRYDFGAEARFGTFALRDGTKADVMTHIATHFPETLACIDTEAAIQAGVFGTDPLHPNLRQRLGDVIITTRTGYVLVDRQHDFRSISRHGGMSEWEMLVPLIWKQV